MYVGPWRRRPDPPPPPPSLSHGGGIGGVLRGAMAGQWHRRLDPPPPPLPSFLPLPWRHGSAPSPSILSSWIRRRQAVGLRRPLLCSIPARRPVVGMARRSRALRHVSASSSSSSSSRFAVWMLIQNVGVPFTAPRCGSFYGKPVLEDSVPEGEAYPL